eukprot:jgi/Tetstr1/442056/TSEL_030235.t1
MEPDSHTENGVVEYAPPITNGAPPADSAPVEEESPQPEQVPASATKAKEGTAQKGTAPKQAKAAAKGSADKPKSAKAKKAPAHSDLDVPLATLCTLAGKKTAGNSGQKRKGNDPGTTGKKKKPKKSPAGNSKSSAELHNPPQAVDKQLFKDEAAAKKQMRPIERVMSEEKECARMKPGSIRKICYQLLTEAGLEGLSSNDLIQLSMERNLRDWGDTQPKPLVHSVLCKDPLFVRIKYGIYSTAYLYPDGVPEEACAKPKKASGPAGDKAQPKNRAPAKSAADSAPRAEGGGQSSKPKVKRAPADPLTALRKQHSKAQQQLESANASRAAAEELLAEIEARVKAEEAKLQTPRKSRDHDLVEMPAFEVSAEERAYTGPPDDRKALVAHKRNVQRLIAKVEQEKLSWIREQKQKAVKARQEARRGVEELQAAKKKAAQAVSVATREVEAAAKVCAALDATLQKPPDSMPLGPADDTSRGSQQAAAKQGSLLAFGFKRAPLQPRSGNEPKRAQAASGVGPSGAAPTAVRKPVVAAALEARLAAIAAAANSKSEAKKLERANHKVAIKAEKHRVRELAKLSKQEERDKEREEKARHKAAEKEERERKRLEALDAKRYPIEDLQLQQELSAKGVQQPEVDLPQFSSQAEGEQMARLLYVSDLTQRFSKELVIKPVAMDALRAALSGELAAVGTGKKAAANDLAGFEIVAQLYQGLLATILEDDVNSGFGGRMERRWVSLLGPGTWPEVLRRYILLSHKAAQEDEDAVQLVQDEVASCARLLSKKAPEELSPEQHLLLLESLANEALATAELRAALASRLEGADEVLKDLRAERAEDRKQIREVEEQLKEERKRKREEAAAEAAARAEAEAAAKAASSAAEGGDAAATETEAAPPGGKADAAAEAEDAEPSWELGPEFTEFRGDGDDRKALLEWRQRVNAERQRLEKEKLRWHAEKRRRDKERDRAEKLEAEARMAKQRELEKLQDDLEEKQEAYERELDKYIVRQAPLGLDRHRRRYWWGLGAVRGVVYVESETGEWAAITTPEELDKLYDSLDKRGLREAELRDSIDKYYHTIFKAMKRAVSEMEKLKKAEDKSVVVPERVLPRRAGSAKAKAADAAADKVGKPASVEDNALAYATDCLMELAELAHGAGARLPGRSLDKFGAQVGALVEQGANGGSYEAVVSLLQELEGALYELSGQEESLTEEDVDEDDEADAEAEADAGKGGGRMPRSRSACSIASSTGNAGPEGAPPAADDLASEVHEYVHSDDEDEDASGREVWRTGRKKTWLYRHVKERSAWRQSLQSTTCLSSAAYNTGVLLECATAMTAVMAGAKRKAGEADRGGAKRQR